jgi:hypothetical protein
MTRAEHIKIVKDGLHKFIDEKINEDSKVDVDLSQGICEILRDGYVETSREPNDTYSLVVLVNGGAHNTERKEE